MQSRSPDNMTPDPDHETGKLFCLVHKVEGWVIQDVCALAGMINKNKKQNKATVTSIFDHILIIFCTGDIINKITPKASTSS
jgi:hypothetical protein